MRHQNDTQRDKRRAGEVMLEGVEVIEVDDSSFSESAFEDAPREEQDLMSQKLQFVKRELFEIRDLLGPVH